MSAAGRPDNGERASATPPSIQSWTRYQNVELLGAGGMGRVYKATDPRLHRVVALKFLRDNEADHVRRLLREAQAQASIDHPNICKVYEVGEVQGQSYIAMQYIEGKSLRAMNKVLPLDAKIEIMRKVAEAMHAAHRLGVIHRDIKTANIMLESGEDGGLRPYIMDFGLAHVPNDGSKSERTGVVEGTPSYMSPEQAQGQTSLLDRRTDIYSVGACLYEILAGQPPFMGANSIEVIMKLLHEEPEPLHKRNASVPLDLEAIVFKCLEKEPARRYESAKALAEDLRRYLDGEPVVARRASLGYRLIKKARRNKALVGISGVALAVVLTLSAFGVRLEVRAREQARLAQRLGHDVEEIESFLRFAYSMPPHDIGPEKEVVRGKMAAIARTMDSVGTIGQGPGQYALGRGHLVLHEYEEALARLTAAAQAGHAGPELEYATGQALGGLYHRELDEAERIADKDARDARKKEIAKKYLLPALEHIRKGEGAGQATRSHVEAMIAFYEARYADAARVAHEAADRSPWLYETRELEGAAYFAVAAEKEDRGDHEGALGDLTRAHEAYQKAADIARSDGDVQESLAEAWLSVMAVQINVGKDPKGAFDNVLLALDRALLIHRESANAFSKKSRAHWLLGEHAFATGADPRAHYQQAISSGREALRLNPKDAVTLDNIGNAAISMGAYEDERGLDPRASYDVALQALQQSIEINPAFAWAWNDMGTAEQLKADYQARRGEDARPALERAIALFKHAIEVDPKYAFPYGNMGSVYATLALHDAERGKDPRALASLGVEACRAALERNKGFGAALTNMGSALLAVALYQLVSGLDPRASIEEALEASRRKLEINPSGLEAHQNITNAHRLGALYLLGQGADASGPLAKAKAARAKMLELDPSSPRSWMLSSQVDLVEARMIANAGGDPKSAFLAAEAAISKAATLNPLDPAIHEAGADLSRFVAEHRLKRREPAAEELERGLSWVEKATAINPRSPRILALRGALLLLRARSPGVRGAAADARLAVASLDEAMRDNPAIQREFGQVRAGAAALVSP